MLTSCVSISAIFCLENSYCYLFHHSLPWLSDRRLECIISFQFLSICKLYAFYMEMYFMQSQIFLLIEALGWEEELMVMKMSFLIQWMCYFSRFCKKLRFQCCDKGIINCLCSRGILCLYWNIKYYKQCKGSACKSHSKYSVWPCVLLLLLV